MSGKTPQEIVDAGGREVTVTNPAKVLFPQAGHARLDLGALLPGGRGRRACLPPADGPMS